MCLELLVAGKSWAIFTDGTLTPADGKVTFTLQALWGSGDPLVNGTIRYGVSKTNLSGSLAATIAEMGAGKEVSGLTNGTKYYFQFRMATPVAYVGCNSGIYHSTPAA